MVYRSVDEIDFKREELPPQPLPKKVLLTEPTFYDVTYAINPHMADNIGRVNRSKAETQWYKLRDVYDDLGYSFETMKGVLGLPDMVFCANQTLPVIQPDATRQVVLSRMYASERKDEVPHFERFFRRRRYNINALPEGLEGSFEGTGDAIWHTGRYLLWGGYGFRSDPAIYDYLTERLELPIMLLELQDPIFYHLDTCLCVLEEQTALIYPDAFSSEGLRLIEHMFDTVIDAPAEEARELLACNAHCPDGQHVIIQKGCDTTVSELKAAGFTPIELDLSEYLKAGGSAYCMKLMYW